MNRAAAIPALVFALACSQQPANAAENPYDVLGKTLAPILNVFLKEPRTDNRALRAEMKLLDMTKLAPEHAGTKVVIALENPDKMLLSGPVLGQEITVCRDGQEIWAYPGDKIEALIDQLGELPKRKKKFRFEKFELPFPEKNLVFLPVLFQVRDGGVQELNGVSTRMIDFALMDQIARSLEVQEWVARVWVGADYKPLHISLSRPGWHVTVQVTKLDYAEELPAATWEPTPEQAGNVLRMDAPRFKQIFDAAAAHIRGEQ